MIRIVPHGPPPVAPWGIVGVPLKNGIGMAALGQKRTLNPAAPNLIGLSKTQNPGEPGMRNITVKLRMITVKDT